MEEVEEEEEAKCIQSKEEERGTRTDFVPGPAANAMSGR